MSKIRAIANNIFWDYNQARKSENWNKPEPPPDENYTYGEVSNLIDRIMENIEGEIVDKYLERK